MRLRTYFLLELRSTQFCRDHQLAMHYTTDYPWIEDCTEENNELKLVRVNLSSEFTLACSHFILVSLSKSAIIR